MNEPEFLGQVLKGHTEAVELVRLLGSISQTWDDLIDRDKAVSDDAINQSFVYAIVRLPANRFYQDHFSRLHPIIELSVYDWLTANTMESGGDHEKSIAFVIRDSLISVVVMCARIIGGAEYAISVAPGIRRYYHRETLQDYTREVGA